ncbi:MAG: 1,4-alpha-glucan branching protein GlgB [Puniceicoccales bacterium]|jgi:1,4-alpha-glucan branching enzyme|nr:1,4-alpha-glucan branching protein GlgB [Puniceicoccales bacterium]
MILSQPELASFLQLTQSRPHDFLGMHVANAHGKRGLVARAWLDDAAKCELVEIAPERGDALPAEVSRRKTAVRAVAAPRVLPLVKLHESGFFEGFLAGENDVFSYQLRITRHNGEVHQIRDPYAFLPTLGDTDLYLINEGTDHLIYQKLGSRIVEHDGVRGVAFAVWAPAARRVSLVGDFNRWDGRYHLMRQLGASGIWEIFVPSLKAGAHYKYEILSPASPTPFLKSDPCAVFYEPPPHNASVVYELGGAGAHVWGDADWLAARAKTDWQKKPISIYEMHLGSWRRVPSDGNRPLTYRELATQLPAYLRETGFTHVEFLPPAEHPFDGSWGYQVTGFYAPTQRFGSPHDFMFLVDALHAANIGVIVDWVPAHFPRDAFALAGFDGTHLYEHADPRQGAHQDWGTLVFNYGRHEVRAFLVGSALAWFDRFHIDGLRVDAVASMLYLDYSRKVGEWVPNKFGGRENLEAIEFLRRANSLVHSLYPGALTIAEESTSFAGVTRPVAEGGLGFDLKWNMGWMHDTLDYIGRDPLFRKWDHNKLTFGMLYQYSERFSQVFSHDEVVHGKGSMLNKMPQADISARAQNLRAFYAFFWTWPGKKTLFMGCEFGQSAEWKYDQSLDWHLLQYIDHEGVRRVVRDLNKLYREDAALAVCEQTPIGFEWVEADAAAESVLAYLRRSEDNSVTWLVVCNFTPVERTRRIGVPFDGEWREVLNTAAAEYGGPGSGNFGVVSADSRHSWDNRPHSLNICLPAMSTVVFRKIA